MQNRASLAALHAIIEVTSQPRGIEISLDKRERWCVTLAPTRLHGSKAERYAVAPQLHHALVALTYLEDGDQVLLDESGNVLCQTCENDLNLDCPECQGSALAATRPKGWPEKGLRAAILEKYP